MSWIKENYHIAAVAGGALVLLGLGFTSYSNAQTTKDGFTNSGGQKKENTGVDGSEIVAELETDLDEVNKLDAQKTPTGRPLNLFTSVDLYTEDGKHDELLDLLVIDKKVHPPIPNQWWVDHMIDPSWSDSPQRDQDGDGFTNEEEFTAKTDPNDPKSIGDLFDKLKVADVQSAMWLLEFNSVLGRGFQFNFKYRAEGGDLQTNRMGASDAIDTGDNFFKDGVGKDRFKLLSTEKKPVETSAGTRDVPFAMIEDLLPSKNGLTYELQFGLKQAELNETVKFDHTVTFYLDAIGEAGTKFEVVENGTFSLPSGGEEAIYQLTAVNLDKANNNEPVSVVVKRSSDGLEKTIPVK